jgi:uncharacterized protein (TIRG00374 family)
LPWLKAAVAITAVGYMLTRQPWPEVRNALALIPPGAFLQAVLISLAGLGLGALRWRMVLVGLGAGSIPAFRELYRLYLVGLFYNTFLPFSVTGDVMRAVVVRGAFEREGATASVASVFIERVLGLSGVLGLTLLAIALQDETSPVRSMAIPALLALPAVLAAALLLPLASRAVRFLPARLRAHARNLPRVFSVPALLAAFGLSLLTQGAVVVVTHLLARAAYPDLLWRSSLLAAPLAAAAAFLPVSIAGIGPRDVLLVALYEMVGVPRAKGTATALALLVLSLTVALVGGVVELAVRRPGRRGRA